MRQINKRLHFTCNKVETSYVAQRVLHYLALSLSLITNLSILPHFFLGKMHQAVFIYLLSFKLTEFIPTSGILYFWVQCFSPKIHIAHSRSTLSSELKRYLLSKAFSNTFPRHALVYYTLSSSSQYKGIYLLVYCFSSNNLNWKFQEVRVLI